MDFPIQNGIFPQLCQSLPGWVTPIQSHSTTIFPWFFLGFSYQPHQPITRRCRVSSCSRISSPLPRWRSAWSWAPPSGPPRRAGRRCAAVGSWSTRAWHCCGEPLGGVETQGMKLLVLWWVYDFYGIDMVVQWWFHRIYVVLWDLCRGLMMVS